MFYTLNYSYFQSDYNISLKSIHFGQYSNALSDDTLKSVCSCAIARCNKDSDWRDLIDPRIYQKDAGNMMRNMSKQIQERNPIIKLFMQDKRGIKEQRCDVRIYTCK